jgi:N6-adenosine-specific RNA methylase IME4
LAALPVPELLTPDAVLFFWAVQPLLPEAMQILAHWGFSFKTVAFYWIKMPANWTEASGRVRPRLGLGYHTRSGAEQCWLAVRGRGYKRQSQGVEQVLHAPLREHSRKPDEIAHRIEQLVGDVPRVELFARTRRPGWTAWGDEIDRFNGGGSFARDEANAAHFKPEWKPMTLPIPSPASAGSSPSEVATAERTAATTKRLLSEEDIVTWQTK